MRTLISFAVAGALLYFLVARFDVDLGATWRHISKSNPWLYLLGFVSYYVSFLVRGLRWRIIAANAEVHREPGARLPSVGESSLLILLGWFLNSIGWLRMGDAYRAYAFADASRSSFSSSLGTVVAERVMDVVAVFGLILAAAAALALGQGVTPSPVFLLTGLGLTVVGVLVVLLMAGFGRRLARFLPQRLQRTYERFHRGTLGSFKQLPLLAFLSVVGWLLEVGRLYLVVKALGLSLSGSLVLFVALANAILTTVPFTPGGLGIVEPGIVGLLALSLARDMAVSVAVLDRSISYVSIIVIGGIAFVVRHFLTRSRAAPQSLGLPAAPAAARPPDALEKASPEGPDARRNPR